MKNFRIQIRYQGYYATFHVMAEDTKESVEKSILDKLGENKVPIHHEEVLGVRVATRAPEGREA